MPHRRTGRFAGGVARRKTNWALGPASAAQAIVASVAQIGATTFAPAVGSTVVRIRGEFLAYLIAATAVNDGFIGAFGVGIATSPAIAAGAGSVPMPLNEASSENWLFHRFIHLLAPASITAAAATDADLSIPVTAALRFEIDSKAMRKTQDLQLYVALEVNETGTASLQWQAQTRVLVMLP